MPRVAAVEVDVATVPDVVPEARPALRGSGGLSADRLEHADVTKLAAATRPAVAIARQTNDRIQRITPPMPPWLIESLGSLSLSEGPANPRAAKGVPGGKVAEGQKLSGRRGVLGGD